MATLKKETAEGIYNSEVEFLKKVLKIQHDGGFGKHLDSLILNRINEFEGYKKAFVLNGDLVLPDIIDNDGTVDANTNTKEDSKKNK